QDVTHRTEGSALASEVNVLDSGLSLAGFEVTLYGRFWVTAEATELLITVERMLTDDAAASDIVIYHEFANA
ncbi:MAG: hypothetical protein ACR2I2_09545, partial [Bryobacteraceae bacterium]